MDAGPRANDAAAVMVWLHGGGNLYGAANEPNPLWLPDAPLFDGCPLAEKWKVIVVTLNHRLGVFGFFMHPSLTAEDPANTGNQGLLDQRAALEWVRKTEAEYLAALHQLYGDLADEVATVYLAGKFASPQEALNRAYADFLLVCPTYDSARRAAAGGASVYLYNFARAPPFPVVEALKLGATHTAELGYVFGPVEPPSATDAALAAAMQGYWTRFARAGDPNGEGAPSWPRYGDASDQRLNLDADISVISGFRRPECEFWWGAYDREFE